MMPRADKVNDKRAGAQHQEWKMVGQPEWKVAVIAF